MGKKKWQRIKLADLADVEEQKRILDLIAQANEGRAREPRKRSSQTAQEGRLQGEQG